MQFLFHAVIVAAVVGCLVGWVVAWYRGVAGRAILPYETRRAVPWGLVDLGIAFVVVVLSQVVALGILRIKGFRLTEAAEGLPTSQQITLMAGMGCASLVAWAIVLVLVRLRSRATWDELGFAPEHWRRDVWLGLAGFAMLSVPVFLVQLLLTVVTEPFDFGKHPLIESLLEDPDPTFFVVGAFAAVLVAPLVEECFFRLLFQGWLENLSLYYVLRRQGRLADELYTQRLILGSLDWPALDDGSPLATEKGEGVKDAVVLNDVGNDRIADLEEVEMDRIELLEDFGVDAVDPNPWSPPQDTNGEIAITAAPVTEALPRPARWPIVVSAAFFAVAHIGHGVAPVPLFLLAVGLGYLYQRTHRVLPCIVVHVLVNGISMAQLWVMTQMP